MDEPLYHKYFEWTNDAGLNLSDLIKATKMNKNSTYSIILFKKKRTYKT